MSTTQPTPGDAEILLTRVDEGLTVLGVVVVLIGIWWWRMRVRVHQDPLAGSPIRRSKLTAPYVFGTVFAAMLVTTVAVTVSEGALPGGWPAEARENVANLLGASAMHVALMVSCLVVAAHGFPGGIREFGFGRTSWKWDGVAAVVLWLVAVALTQLVLLVTLEAIELILPDYELPEHGVFQALRYPELGAWVAVLAHASALLIAPLGEEIFFRGIVQSSVMKLAAPRWGSLYHRHVAVGAAAVLFGLMHWSMPHHIPPLIVLGLILGYAYERTGSLRVPILIHVLFNGKSLLWNALMMAI